MRMFPWVAPLAILAAPLALPLAAQEAERSSPPVTATQDASPLPPTRDVAFPGTIRIHVDASDTRSKAFRTTQQIPVPAGMREMVLVYPKWLPGNHAASGQIQRVSRLTFSADGAPVEWQRDPREPYAFRLALPAGAREVTAELIYTSPLDPGDWRVLITDEMLNLQWEKMTLYPAGHYVRRIAVEPSVTLPAGWEVAGALEDARREGDRVTFAATDYETLVDSPLFAGAHHRRWSLVDDVDLEVFADHARDLEADDKALPAHRAMVAEALATFGSRHYDHYDFLLGLTDRLGGIGLEHHRSSENTQEPGNLREFAKYTYENALLPHEFAHSWNGKFRRPAGLWAPDYHQRVESALLWMYEGQTQFWGVVHAARSGMMPKDQALGWLAQQAAYYSVQAGREWRSVEDSTFDPMLGYRADRPFPSLSRNRDYYSEAALVWLEADQIIRQGTRGRRSLDDFARRFFGMRDGDWGVVTYEFEDIVAALNAVHPYDWAGFLDMRMRQASQPAPLAGIEKGGYRLVWKDTPNPYTKAAGDGAAGNFSGSLGLSLSSEGRVGGVLWGLPGFEAGLVEGTTVVAVDGMAFTRERMAEALREAAASREPIELIVRRGDAFETIALPYYDGVRYPWLEKTGSGTTGLDRTLAPRRK
ncbi:M61 family metallopeptidase [Qipengyuania sp. MTN3-11]|uniref:M61 family metallopeptidase n=1 Tax=Qipengyuania sp. MTN3-11 TaxID=3056557 RepID=UPI0036F1FAAA